MRGVNEDAYWDQVQARVEHWADEGKGPHCEKCGQSLRGYYAYDTPAGLFCENCTDDWLFNLKQEMERNVYDD